MHCQTLNFFDHTCLDLTLFLLLLLLGCQGDLENALFDEIVIIKGTLHLRTTSLVTGLEIVVLGALKRVLVKHVRVEETADVFVITLQTLENE